MISARPLRLALLGFSAALFALLPAHAAPKQVDGPVTVIITYRATPGNRIAFGHALETEGAARFAQWKQSGVFTDYRLLFSSFAGSRAGDLFAVLRFAKFSDTLRWQEIEKDFPGGLSPETAKLAEVQDESVADSIGHGEVADRDSSSAIFLAIEYDVTSDNATFKKFISGHGIPQMKVWMKEGVITSYGFYLNQSAVGSPWTAFLVLEYKDIASLARREEVKDKAREELAASDPDFKTFAAMTLKVRKEKAQTTTRLILPR